MLRCSHGILLENNCRKCFQEAMLKVKEEIEKNKINQQESHNKNSSSTK